MLDIRVLVLISALLWLPGCGLMMASETERLAHDVSGAILNQNDPMTVKEGAPAYLILIDGLIAGDPDNPSLLLTGARLYGVFSSAFVDDAERARRLTDKSWQYGKRALCREQAESCQQYQRPYAEYVEFLSTLGYSDVPVLYGFGASWAGWIQTHRDDWNALADIPKVQATMQRVLELDESYRRGGVHAYLGVLSLTMPPALGGKPEEARAHFERAIALSDGHNLMFKVLFAERYARTVFDRDLHDRLLREVVEADTETPGLTLMNMLAQEKARHLLETGDDYF